MMRAVSLEGTSPTAAKSDVVHVPKAVYFPSGRRLKPGTYTVEGTHGRLLIVRTALDCSPLQDKRFQITYAPDQSIEHVPRCAEPALFYLAPGDWTAYADGRGTVTIPDLPHRS